MRWSAVAGVVLALTCASPASAVDADRRLGGAERPQSPERSGLLADRRADPLPDRMLDPRHDGRCLRVRVVPVGADARPPEAPLRDLLLVPCRRDAVPGEPARPWGDRPPIVIPLEGRS